MPPPAAPDRSALPPLRPGAGTDAAVQPASAIVPAPPAPAPTQGALCGDPALAGRLIAPIRAGNSACGLEDGVEVTKVAGLALSQPATIDCPTARALSGWVQGALLPAARKGGMSLAKLEIADSYACRPRNNVRGNKTSEHGKGHAIDISALVLRGGDSANVQRDWGKGAKGRLLAAVRRAACGPFTTVLGPGSDRFHRNHLHFDTARGRGAYCR
ncbi:MAG: extensin family protein [Proteobacteria bacterium]|nr:extensin family protein [Pseudomonadota bacterium]MBS0573760.1 extensin family protein [Pseudomonadota bacterium]